MFLWLLKFILLKKDPVYRLSTSSTNYIICQQEHQNIFFFESLSDNFVDIVGTISNEGCLLSVCSILSDNKSKTSRTLMSSSELTSIYGSPTCSANASAFSLPTSRLFAWHRVPTRIVEIFSGFVVYCLKSVSL